LCACVAGPRRRRARKVKQSGGRLRKCREVTRALVNVDFGPAMILGSGMVASGLALYQVRVVRPEVSKDYDIMFASVALLCGGILIFQGWRLDPLLLFGQILTAAAAATFAAEAVNLRGQVNEEIQARVDREMEKERRRGGGSVLPGQETSGDDYDAEDRYYGTDGYGNVSESYYSSSAAGSYGGGRGRAQNQQPRGPGSYGFSDRGRGYEGRGGDYVEFERQQQSPYGNGDADDYESFDFVGDDDEEGLGEGQDFLPYDINSDWD